MTNYGMLIKQAENEYGTGQLGWGALAGLGGATGAYFLGKLIHGKKKKGLPWLYAALGGLGGFAGGYYLSDPSKEFFKGKEEGDAGKDVDPETKRIQDIKKRQEEQAATARKIDWLKKNYPQADVVLSDDGRIGLKGKGNKVFWLTLGGGTAANTAYTGYNIYKDVARGRDAARTTIKTYEGYANRINKADTMLADLNEKLKKLRKGSADYKDVESQIKDITSNKNNATLEMAELKPTYDSSSVLARTKSAIKGNAVPFALRELLTLGAATGGQWFANQWLTGKVNANYDKALSGLLPNQ